MEESPTATEKEYGKRRIWDQKHRTWTNARTIQSKDEEGKKQIPNQDEAKGSKKRLKDYNLINF